MATEQVPVGEWVSFFDNFSKEHAGKSATIEVSDTGANQQLLAEKLPFIGISADLKDNEKDITITLGGRTNQSLTHIINTPLSVELDSNNSSLLISSESEGSTRLSLQG
ncbi:hypothetical protein BH10CHL1_BH10CHL1_03170 [soil metagenome]